MKSYRTPGTLTPVYWISCGACGKEDNLLEEKKPNAFDRARVLGWVQQPLARLGWTCPECTRDLNRLRSMPRAKAHANGIGGPG